MEAKGEHTGNISSGRVGFFPSKVMGLHTNQTLHRACSFVSCRPASPAHRAPRGHSRSRGSLEGGGRQRERKGGEERRREGKGRPGTRLSEATPDRRKPHRSVGRPPAGACSRRSQPGFAHVAS